jgi:signal transduction histidine kinase
VQREVQRFDLVLRASLAALGVGLLVAVIVQVSFGLRPLDRVARQIEAVRRGAADRLSRSGSRELDLLVDEINSLIEHNEQVIARGRASASDLAHALKTPLAILRSSPGEDAEQREQIAAMERIITRHLARAATAGPGRHTPVPLTALFGELANGLQRVYAERTLQLQIDVAPALAYPADREDLEEILGNLLENAFKWARTRIRVRADVRDAQLSVCVEDDGPGIDSLDRPRATERGTRLDEHTPGSGLGLAIVTDVVATYGGSLRLSRSELGGLRAEVCLPQSPPRATSSPVG